ncbi:hypothetical protein Taro_014148 [Colocasia esculenta]|uniref:Uncharacterized protein n=1 Tax=Colocasia esculenta TaxID=4460 RepID=A0A843U8C9_COLES|nr:hypothetical protein [Colocasia esculenta]
MSRSIDVYFLLTAAKWSFTSSTVFAIPNLKWLRFLRNLFRKSNPNGETGVPVLEEDIVRSDSEREE